MESTITAFFFFSFYQASVRRWSALYAITSPSLMRSGPRTSTGTGLYFVDGACEAGIQRVKCGSKWWTAIIVISKYVVTAPYIWHSELEYNTCGLW